MGAFDNVKFPGQEPVQPAAASGSFAKVNFPAAQTPQVQPQIQSSNFAKVKFPDAAAPSTKPSPYFYGTTTEGATLGRSDQLDTSGKPFFSFRNPGDTNTTTDRTRIATTFDPRTPQKLDAKTFYNPRAIEERTKIRKELGASYNEDLDHQIALELSGSNNTDNLSLQPSVLNRGKFAQNENSLARRVAKGEISLFDAQIEDARQKGKPLPNNFREKLPGIDKPFTSEEQKQFNQPAKQETPQIEIPKDAKAGDVFTGSDGNKYQVQAPSLHDLGRSLLGVSDSPTVAVPLTNNTQTSTPKENTKGFDVIDYLFNPKAKVDVRPLGSTKEEAKAIGPLQGPRIITGAASMINNAVADMIKLPVRFAVDAYQTFIKGGSDIHVPGFLQDTSKRLDLPVNEQGIIESIGERTLKKQEANDKKSPSTPVRNTLDAFTTEVLPTIFGGFLAADIATSASKEFLAKTGFNYDTLSKLRQYDINPDQLQSLDPLKARQLVAQQAKARVQTILQDYVTKFPERVAEIERGVLPGDLVKSLNGVSSDIESIGSAYFNAPKGKLSPIGNMLRNIADQATRPVSEIGGATAFRDIAQKPVGAISETGVKPDTTPSNWKPSMTPEEATAFSKDSAIKDTLTHNTNGEAASKIQSDGFKVSTKQIGPDGVYLSNTKEGASNYGQNALDVKVNVQNVKEFKDGGDFLQAVEDKYGDFTREKATLFSKQWDAIVLKKEGYTVITDPKNITVIKPAPEQFKGFEDITTNILDNLKGKTTVSKQFISDLTNGAALKQAERNVIRQVLEQYPGVSAIPVKEFADKVKSELLPITNEAQFTGSDNAMYEGITLPDNLRGSVKDYKENVYGSPVKTSAGDVHAFGTDNYFAHTRVEDMADNTTRRVIEVQSDLFQKGRLDGEIKDQQTYIKANDDIINDPKRKLESFYEEDAAVMRAKNTERQATLEGLKNKLEPYKNTWQDRIVREEIKQAARDNIMKLQFPTGETAMKIEGLAESDANNFTTASGEMMLRPDMLKEGMEIKQASRRWIIIDVKGDGKFGAIPKQLTDQYGSVKEALRNAGDRAENFDISGKVDTNNPIYKFYEKDLGKYLKKFNAEKITDPQGVSWYQINVPKGAAKEPVSAFSRKNVFSKVSGPKMTIDQAKKAVFENIDPKEVRLAFESDLIDGIATGQYKQVRDGLKGPLKPIIKLYEEGNKVGARTVYEEVGHYLFDNALSDNEKTEALNIARQQMTATDKAKLKLSGYKDDQVLEEFIVKKWAKAEATKAGFKGPFQKIFELLSKAIKKIVETYKKVKKALDDMLPQKGRQGGYINLFEDGGGEIKADFKANEKGNIELNKQLRKEAPGPTAQIDKTIGDLETQRTNLEETLRNNPARQLSKFVNQSGELPEVLGEGNIFGKTGDQLANELGYSSSEDARLAYQNYKLQQKRLGDLKRQLGDARFQRAQVVKEDKDAKSLNHLLNKTARSTDDIIKKQEHLERLRKADETAAKKMAEEKQYELAYQHKVAEARAQAAKSKGFIARIRARLNPLKSLDDTTKSIFTGWFTKKGIAKQLAQDAFIEAQKLGVQNFEEVILYQAGSQTPYIRESFDSMQTEFIRRGLDIKYVDNYVPQVWQNNSKEFDKAAKEYLKEKGLTDSEVTSYMNGVPLPEATALRLKLKPNFVKARFWPDYVTGIKHGLRPKYSTPAQLIAYYRESGEAAIANRELISELKQEAKLLPGDEAPDTWIPVTIRFSREGLYAPREIADLINGKFRDEDNLSVFEHISKVGSVVSKTWQELKLSAGIPFTSLNYFTIGQAIKLWTTAIGETSMLKFPDALSSLKASFSFIRSNSNTASAKFFYDNRDTILRMARNGLDVTGNVGSYKGLYKQFSGIGMKDKIGLAFSKAFNEKTFSSMMPQISVQIFKDSYQAAFKAGMTEEFAENYAADVTATFGGLVRENGRGATTRETLSSLFFAPAFRENLINVFLNAGKSFTTEFRNPAFSKSRALLVGMAITFALYDLLNKKLTGHHLWENPPGREFSLRIPLGSDVLYTDFMPSFLAMPRAIGTGVFSLFKGDLSTAAQKAGSFFSMPIRTGFDLLSNKDYFGNPIWKDTDTATQKIKKGAEYVGVAANHPFISETYKYWTGRQPLYQSIVYMMELPAKFSSLDKEAKSSFYAAQEKKKIERARDRDRIQPIYDKNQKLKADGNIDEANAIYDALSDHDKEIYNTIKTTAKRVATMTRKPIIQKTYDDNQKLLSEGRYDEADAIYDNLSDEDRRIYDKIKAANK